MSHGEDAFIMFIILIQPFHHLIGSPALNPGLSVAAGHWDDALAHNARGLLLVCQ